MIVIPPARPFGLGRVLRRKPPFSLMALLTNDRCSGVVGSS